MDKAKLELIKTEYDAFYKNILQTGKLPLRATRYGFWAATPADLAFKLFTTIRLEKHKSFADLGSGDGVVVAVASLFTHATGIEEDPQLCENSTETAKKLGLDCEFKRADFTDENLSSYDTIFINPDNNFYKLEGKLLSEFKGTLIVAGSIYRPLQMKPKQEIELDGQKFLIY